MRKPPATPSRLVKQLRKEFFSSLLDARPIPDGGRVAAALLFAAAPIAYTGVMEPPATPNRTFTILGTHMSAEAS